MSTRDRDHLDSAIDHVSRRMVDVPDDDAMTDRIVAALPARPAGAMWLLVSWAPRFALVALLTVGIATWMFQRRVNVPVSLPLVASVNLHVTPAAPVVHPARLGTLGTLPVAAVAPQAPLVLASGADHERALPPVSPPVALEVSELAPHDLPAVAVLRLEPLEIGELPLTAQTFSQR